MDTLNRALGWLLESFIRLFAWAHPLVGLAVISVLAGIGMLWIFARVSNPAAITRAKRKVYAHLMELRLFVDEPAMMWRAQAQLMTANLRYLGMMVIPAIVVAIPMIVLLIRLDAYYGRAPLPVGASTLVTMETTAPLDASAPPPVLRAPAGIAVETPAVRIPSKREVTWRIRALRPVSGELSFALPEGSVEKRIVSGDVFRFVPGRRTGSAMDALWYPDERRIERATVNWIDIEYPGASIEFLGLRWHWLVWFTIVSFAAALALKKRFRVVL